jgi:hypothetical protein
MIPRRAIDLESPLNSAGNSEYFLTVGDCPHENRPEIARIEDRKVYRPIERIETKFVRKVPTPPNHVRRRSPTRQVDGERSCGGDVYELP